MVAIELAASRNRIGQEMSLKPITPCSANEANTVHAVPKKQSRTMTPRLPIASSPGLNRKKNGTTKPPIASFTAQGPSDVGLTPAIAPAAKFATATGGVIADRHA